MRDDGCPGRHCWVNQPDGRRPGLLVEWRRDYTPADGAHPAGAGNWQGRVIYMHPRGAGRWATVEEWVDADRLEVATL